MKIEEIDRPGLIALGVAGIASIALLGFAVGAAVGRDPQAIRRTLRWVAHGVERASLTVAQAREHVGDLWAEAREDAIAAVDAADFERATATAATMPSDAAATAAKAAPVRATRKRAASPRKARRPTTTVAQSVQRSTIESE